MHHTEINPVSPHLLAEHDRLLSQIATIRKSGTVAPAYCWLIQASETKGSRTYTYIKLLSEQPHKKLTSKSLGKPGSQKHRAWQEAIRRRETIAELEQQLKILETLIERQQRSLH